MYQECPASVRGAVVWRGRTDSTSSTRVLPDGCIDIIWDGSTLMAVGPDRRSRLVRDASAVTRHAIRFAPGQGPIYLGVPASALTDLQVSLADLWGDAVVRPIVDALSDSPDPGMVLDRLIGEVARSVRRGPASVARIVELSRAGTSVAGIADDLGMSERQVRRVSVEAFGYGPKHLGRVLRLQRALALARGGLDLAGTAYAVGCADQQHLAREARDLGGTTLTSLLA